MNFAKNILESCQSKGNLDFNVSFSSEVFTFLYNAQKALMQTSGLLLYIILKLWSSCFVIVSLDILNFTQFPVHVGHNRTH